MTGDLFKRIVEHQLALCKEVLGFKRGEYADGGDRLHNFKVAAALRGLSAIDALGGMMVKHTVSVYDMIPSGASFDLLTWDRKITDHINYLLLLKALLCEAVDAVSCDTAFLEQYLTADVARYVKKLL